MLKIPSRYAGKYLALIGKKIVASGGSYKEVYTSAKKHHPHKMIGLLYAPKKSETITFLVYEI